MVIYSIIATIFVLGVLIFVHELGHFIVAKRSGVKVERFSLGYPPKMIGFKRGETEYCISWIPFGGYVKMAGENPDEEELTGAPYEFQSKPIGIRAAIIAAGPIMNFVAAILIFWMVFLFSGVAVVDTNSAVIGLISPNGPAAKAGIIPGDEIVSINGIPVHSFEEMAKQIYKEVEKPIVVEWIRNGKTHLATIITMKDEVVDAHGEKKVVGKIGIGPQTKTIQKGFFDSFTESIKTSVSIIIQLIGVIIGLFSGAISIKAMGGPVQIAQMAGQTAQLGFSSLMTFTAFLSLNLGLLNILPLPVLDGGHLTFLAIEKLRGKPISFETKARIQQVGILLLLVLMITVTYNDILRIFK